MKLCACTVRFNKKRADFCYFQVVVRSREFRRESRNERLRSYFYGKKPHNFFPFSFDVALSDVEVFKIGGTTTLILQCLH